MTASDAFSSVPTTTTTSTSTNSNNVATTMTNNNDGGWSEHEIKTAEWLSVTQKERILAVEGILNPRPVTIKAELVITPMTTDDVASSSAARNGANIDCDDGSSNVIITKIVHFQRHGQGYHNLLGSILRDAGMKLNHSSHDPKTNPWRRPEIVDSPLTEHGKQECYFRRDHVSKHLNPQLIVVSPMLRAIQTATISFGKFTKATTTTTEIVVGNDDAHGGNAGVPWIAHEGCREELGFLVCNKRRNKSLIRDEYPYIDLSLLQHEEDVLWDPHERESPQDMADRVYDFLVNFIAMRDESEIAVICHSAWLFNMCTVILDCGDDEFLASWFKTSEVRSMKLTFIYNNNDNTTGPNDGENLTNGTTASNTPDSSSSSSSSKL